MILYFNISRLENQKSRGGVMKQTPLCLANFSIKEGNYHRVLDKILSRISLNDVKMTYVCGSYFVNYIMKDSICFTVICDDDTTYKTSFACLTELIKLADENYPNNELNSLGVYGVKKINFGKLSKKFNRNLKPKQTDPLLDFKEEINEVTSVMVENVDKLLDRGEKLEILVNRTEELQRESYRFYRNSRTVRRRIQWDNFKYGFLTLLILGIIALFVAIGVCGGITFPNCRE